MKKTFITILTICMALAAFAPLSVDAAEQTSIAKLRKQLADEKAKYDSNQASINLTQSQINEKQNKEWSLQTT